MTVSFLLFLAVMAASPDNSGKQGNRLQRHFARPHFPVAHTSDSAHLRERHGRLLGDWWRPRLARFARRQGIGPCLWQTVLSDPSRLQGGIKALATCSQGAGHLGAIRRPDDNSDEVERYLSRCGEHEIMFRLIEHK